MTSFQVPTIKQRGQVAQAIAAVKNAHCQPPAYKPDQNVSGRLQCPRCRGTIFFAVSADTGRSTGRCNSGPTCVRWANE